MHFKATDKIYKQTCIDFVVYRKCIPRKKIVQLNGLSWKHLFSSTIFVSAMHLPCYSLRSVSIFAWNSLIDSIEIKRPTEKIFKLQQFQPICACERAEIHAFDSISLIHIFLLLRIIPLELFNYNQAAYFALHLK